MPEPKPTPPSPPTPKPTDSIRGPATRPAPRFVVVGHPNTGKSSLVATLAGDASVRIAPEPGTTAKAREFPMRLGSGDSSQTLYTLIDTPGFQRARRCLAWLEQHSTGPADRADTVRRFVAAHQGTPDFPDEVELLAPIVNADAPAGVLYVVDGSTPYGPEYEAEMQILRWTGQPSMAVINPIGDADHTDDWKAALDQFFKIARVLDAVAARFPQQLDLLRAFGQFRDDWRQPLDDAVQVLQQRRTAQRRAAAGLIAQSLADMLQAQATRKVDPDKPEDPALREALQTELMGKLRKAERRCHAAVEEAYDHPGLDREEADLSPDTTQAIGLDLFSQEAWLLFGLKPKHLILAGMAGGAATGGIVDAHLLGQSLLAGTLLGGAAGAAAGWWSAGKVAKLPMTTQRLLGGGTELRCGPITQPNFPFVLLNRALLHHAAVANRTHAMRGSLVIHTDADAGQLNSLNDDQRKQAATLFKTLRKDNTPETLTALTELLDTLLAD
ncbi:MAG: DUF3482 domain-containing protein [Planctomycetota bacterium]